MQVSYVNMNTASGNVPLMGIYEKKLNTIRACNARKLDRVTSSLTGISQQYAATNSYIQQCVSIMMDVPLRELRSQRNVPASVNARMVCFYILKNQTGLSYRQVAALYGANVSMVHRKIKTMELYYLHKFYPELILIVDLVNQAVQEKLALYQYEATQQNEISVLEKVS